MRQGASVAVYLNLKTGEFLVEESTKSRNVPGAHTPSALRAVSSELMKTAGWTRVAESLERYEQDEPLDLIRTKGEQRAFARDHKRVSIRVDAEGGLELTPCHREGVGYVGFFDQDGIALARSEVSNGAFWSALERAFKKAS